MKVVIEIYRGWSILFDTDKETFYCHSAYYDMEKNKMSFKSIKKYIDDFIKENEVFVPFYIEAKPKSFTNIGKVKIIGIRKDGNFVYDEKGNKKILSISDIELVDYKEKLLNNESK